MKCQKNSDLCKSFELTWEKLAAKKNMKLNEETQKGIKKAKKRNENIEKIQ